MPANFSADGDELRSSFAEERISGDTLMGWMRQDDKDDHSNQLPFGLAVAGATTDYFQVISAGGVGDGTVVGEMRGSNQNGSDLLNFNVSENDVWYFYAITYNGTTFEGFWRKFDATSLSSASTSYSELVDVDQILCGENEFLNAWFPGSLAAVKWYDAVLTEAEILNESKFYTSRRIANLQSFYPLLDGAGPYTDYGPRGDNLTEAGTITHDPDGPPISWAPISPYIIIPAPVGGQTVAVGVLAESDALIGVDPEKFAPIGTLGEDNVLVAVPPEKIASIGTLAEVDAFLAIQAEKFVDIGTLAEFNTFLPIPALKPILLAIGTLAEANSLLAIQALKQAPVGMLGESDVFNPIEALKPIIRAVGVLTELNNLLPVVVVQEGGQTIPVGTLAEINAFLSILARKIAAIGVLSESDTLVPITARKIFDVGTLNEVNAFLAIEILGTADIGTLSELEALLSIAADKPITTAIGTLSEDDVLVAVNALRVAQIGTLDELDVLIAIAALKPITVDVGTLAELDALVQILAEAGPEVLRKVTAILQDGLLSGINQAGLTGRGV